MDYEKAAKNLVVEIYFEIQLQGCFYHLSQCIYRKVQFLGFQQKYQEDAKFSLSIRMIPALAFVPLDDLLDVFDKLQESITDDDVLKVIDYFEDNYIGRRRRRNRAPPLFSHEVWNINIRVTNDLPRTNNSVEGWNRKMQSAVGANHPNLWRFLNVLKREQGLLNTIIDQFKFSKVDWFIHNCSRKYQGDIAIHDCKLHTLW